jgi:hypothetical protein
MMRLIQIGLAFIVLTGLAAAIGVVVDVVERQEAIRIALNVTTVIGMCMAAGVVLTLLFRWGREPDRER